MKKTLRVSDGWWFIKKDGETFGLLVKNGRVKVAGKPHAHLIGRPWPEVRDSLYPCKYTHDPRIDPPWAE